MRRLARLLALLALATAAAVVAILARPPLDRARRSLRTSSAPGVGVYDLAAGLLLRGYYDDIAADAAAALEGTPAPGVMEVGPGPGHLAERLLSLLPDARWTGLDIDPDMLEAARGRLARAGLDDRATLVEGDVASMPFDDGAFDLVLTSFSAHHWADASAGFREIRRVLRDGGMALVYDLPPAWAHAETGSRGIDAAAATFDGPQVSRFRGLGPFTIVTRLEMRRPG